MCMDRKEFLFGLTSLGVFGRRLFAAEVPEVPAYYDAYLGEIVAKVNRNRMEGRCDEGFVFLTDLHVRSNFRRSGSLIARIVRETGMKRVLCGGDLTEAFGAEHPSDKAAVDFAIDAFRNDWVKPVRAAGGRLYCAKGNHDFTVRHSMKSEDGERGFTYSGEVAKRLIVDEWSEGDVVTNRADSTACYYFFDVPSAKVRYVVSDTTDTETAGEVGWGVRSGMHKTQLEWLENVAFGTLPKGYSVVAMQHIPLTDVVGTAAEKKLFESYRNLLEGCAASGHRVIDVSGHHHGEVQTWENGVMHLSGPCDAAYRDYAYRSAFCGELPVKTAGSVYEQTFDIIQFSSDRTRLYITRVGGGQDRVVHLDPVVVDVGGRKPLSVSMSAHVCDWVAYDGDTAGTLPNPKNKWCPLRSYKNEVLNVTPTGSVVGKKAGVAMVLARDGRLNKEIFPVQVRN